ncbi:MAG: beta-lactamase family protein [Verrucomicrobia bacterium]|nr:beta-lactamase family protein [Verrucomicrobiota bacterium]
MRPAGIAIDKIQHALGEVFDRNFRERGELGAAVSVWVDGEEVVSLARGFENRELSREWKPDTLVPVWSATKGPAALACLLALDEAQLSLDCSVAEVWPEFSAAGKESVTFEQVLSHQAGLFALDQEVSILDHAAVIAALEAQASAGPPASLPAYHARTFGFLLDEIVRRITGMGSLGVYFHQRIGAPMKLDFWIGLPPEHFSRVAKLYPGRLGPDSANDPFLRAMGTKGSPTQRTFRSPAGLNSVQDMNQAETWAMGLPGLGGVGSARGLAKFYSMLANEGEWQGSQIVPTWCIDAFSKTVIQGQDDVLCAEIAFSAGMMRDPVDVTGAKSRRYFGRSARAFGHPGAGGSLAFADPEHGLSFAYVMNQMEIGALPGPRTLELVTALDATN